MKLKLRTSIVGLFVLSLLVVRNVLFIVRTHTETKYILDINDPTFEIQFEQEENIAHIESSIKQIETIDNSTSTFITQMKQINSGTMYDTFKNESKAAINSGNTTFSNSTTVTYNTSATAVNATRSVSGVIYCPPCHNSHRGILKIDMNSTADAATELDANLLPQRSRDGGSNSTSNVVSMSNITTKSSNTIKSSIDDGSNSYSNATAINVTKSSSDGDDSASNVTVLLNSTTVSDGSSVSRVNTIAVKETKAESHCINCHGMCLSPERDAPWILDGSCMKGPPHLSTFSLTGHHRSCGFCGKGSAYLRKLRDEIALTYEKKCKHLVVYGAALGAKYEKWMRSLEFLGEHSLKVVKRHGTCFIQFVTDVNATGELFSADGSQKLIVIDPTKMPYKNNRRNTKILKFNPGLLFPWAERVIWQDAKLLSSFKGNKPSPHGLPSDYLLHFNRTVGRFGTCSSFVGLPHHKASVNTSPSVNLKAHCDTVVAAAVKRPTVSDNLDVLRTQCERYQERYSNLTDQQSSQVFHQSPLVDSAFIVYDMRSAVCQKFNGDLGCSWLDEIHCYSDRDQISFPHILANSGLRLSPKLDVPGQEFRDRVYINKDDVPMLHIAKRSCHWYYRSFSRCVAPEREEMSDSGEKEDHSSHVTTPTPPGLRVAVIVAGTLQRFMFKSTLEHLIRPMSTKQGVYVDYYASLTTASAKAYRSSPGSTSYTDHLQADPTLPRSILDDSVDIEEYLRKKIGSNLSSIGALKIQESIDIDSEPMLKVRREKAQVDYPNENPDARFPIIDLRSEDIARRTANANRNLLRMHLAIQNLWTSLLKWEAEESFRYDYIFFLRDDSLWLGNFNIENMARKDGNIFIPSCDARDPPLAPNEINDHILISQRDSAGTFGKYYSTLFHDDLLKACMDQMPEKLRRGGKRGCNSEMLLKWVTDEQRLKVTKLSQSEVPFQRSANVKLPDGSNMQCFHKFCQSESFPLKLTGENEELESCKNIDWNALFLPKMDNHTLQA